MSFQTNSIDIVPKVFNEFRTNRFDFIMISRHIFPKNLNHNNGLKKILKIFVQCDTKIASHSAMIFNIKPNVAR